MGCYGWGVSRTMGVLVEKSHDDRGIIWPESVAPFTISLITLDDKLKEGQTLYGKFNKAGIEVLWDDRDISAGSKFADADLIGNPYRGVGRGRGVKDGG